MGGQLVPLVSGAYTAKSIIAEAQRCINLYPEGNPKDSPFPTTHYQTPGLRKLCQADNGGPVRGLYTTGAGDLYAVVDSRLFYVDPTFTMHQLGEIDQGANPVSLSDNQLTLVVVNGTPNGYTLDLATRSEFAQITDPAFQGADRVEFLDTFLIFNQPGLPSVYCTESNSLVFNPLFFAEKIGQNDILQTIALIHRELLLIGSMSCEIWYDAGNVAFPFAEIPGVMVDIGCGAKYSVAVEGGRSDYTGSACWLGQNRQGARFAVEVKAYRSETISTPAIETEWATYATVEDAIGYIYSREGHVFYVLTFPTADKTWVFDKTTRQWHEWSWTDAQGRPHRHRGNCHTFAYGLNIVGDFQNGSLYALDSKQFTDDGNPITRLRSWPHMVGGGNRVNYRAFRAEMEVGLQPDQGGQGSQNILTETGGPFVLESGGKILTEASLTGQSTSPAEQAPLISLRYSDTAGRTWGRPVMQTLGAGGQYLTQPKWTRLGMARDRVFELSWSLPVETALSGAWIDSTEWGGT